MKLKALKKRKAGLICFGIQTLLMLVFFVELMLLNVLEPPMMIGIAAIFVIIDAYVFLTLFTKKIYKIGMGIAIFMSIVLLAGSFYLYKTNDTLGAVTGKDTKVEKLSVIVLKSDTADTIKEISGDTFGILKDIGRENTDEMIANINKECKSDIATAEYTDATSQAKALYDGEVKAIIMNEAYRDLVLETYETFDEDTKVLFNFEKETKVDINQGEAKDKTDITKEPFSVYISGIDTFGEISKTSRSDVNIIATVNPVTKQILLTNTPRDYYVPTTVSNGIEDKLTHAGIYGVDCSVGTLEKLYGIDIKYYVRVNFTGFVDIVDALGGVTVHSDYTFTSDWGPKFVKGNNKVNGEQALAFARERHAFAAGDNQRGKDQQYLLKAIFEKATSPSIIKNFSGLMDSVKDNVETSIQASKISALLKMQLDDMASWNIVLINVTGTGARKTTYSNQSKKGSVMIPNTDTVDAAKEMMNDVIDDKKVTNDQFKSILESK